MKLVNEAKTKSGHTTEELDNLYRIVHDKDDTLAKKSSVAALSSEGSMNDFKGKTYVIYLLLSK